MGATYYARTYYGFAPTAAERVDPAMLGSGAYDEQLASLGVLLISLARGGYALAVAETAAQADLRAGPVAIGRTAPAPDWQDRLRKAAYALGLQEQAGAWWIDLYVDV